MAVVDPVDSVEASTVRTDSVSDVAEVVDVSVAEVTTSALECPVIRKNSVIIHANLFRISLPSVICYAASQKNHFQKPLMAGT